MSASGRSNTIFKFVNFSDPKEVQSGKLRKQVRSHVSKWQHSQTRAKLREAAQSTNKASTGRETTVESSTSESTSSSASQARSDTSAKQRPLPAFEDDQSRQKADIDRNDNKIHEDIYEHDADTTLISPEAYRLAGSDITRAFSQGAMSFQTIALQDSQNIIGPSLRDMQLELSSVMGLYKSICVIQTVDFRRQFEGNEHASWNRFYSFVFTDPILLSTAVLLGVRNQLDILGRCLDGQTFASVMQIQRFLMRSINDALCDPVRGISDQMLIAVALCAAYEIKHGTGACYHVHMRGLVQMVQLRGGLDAIGEPDPYVPRLLVWIDTNTSKIAGCRPYLQGMANGLTAPPKANTLVFRTKGYHT